MTTRRRRVSVGLGASSLQRPPEATATLNGITAPSIEERDTQLRWLLLLRVVVATAVLVVAMYLQFLAGSAFSLRPLFGVAAAGYGFSLIVALVHRRLVAWPPFAAIQLTADIFLATGLIFYLGGVRSAFVVLYLVVVAAAGLMLSRRGVGYIAALAAVCYGVVGLSAYVTSPLLDMLPPAIRRAFETGLSGDPVEANELYLRLFTLILVACTTAWVSFALSARLRRAGTMLKARQAQLRTLRRLHGRIIYGMTSGLLATDAQGTVVTANGAAAEITGWEPGTLVGRPLWQVFGEDRSLVDRLDEILSSNRVYRTDRTIRAADGSCRTIGMTVTRLDGGSDGGEDSQSVSVFMFRDLTEIRRMQRELKIRERMAALGQMAGSIAHEIRNPLASISGSLQLLRRSNLRSDNPDADKLVDIVVRESDRLSRTIEEFLEYARPGKFEPEDTDLLDLMGDTLTLLRNSSELSEDHSLHIVADRGAYRALVDPGQIKQVFWNLARNAIGAMPNGGALEVSLAHTPGGVEVAFADAGSGMTPEEIETFFQPSVSSSAKGTGLGLAVVYRILDRHGVGVEVDSELGKGTRCVLNFGERTLTESDEQAALIRGDKAVDRAMETAGAESRG